MSRNYIIEQLKQTFKDYESFSREALYKFYLQYEPDLKETTFRWRIYNLKDKKLIRPISRNEFTLNYKPVFKPKIEEAERKILTLIEREFKTLKIAVWSTRVINEFMLHQPVRFYVMVEVEKDALEPVFNYLKDNNIRNVFLQPGEKELNRYVSELDSSIIIQSLVSKAPIQKVKKVSTATLEKIIVDLFIDKKLYSAYQGTEMVHIFNTAYRKYTIDFTKLFSYAGRRRREDDLIEFLDKQTEIPKTVLND